VLGKWPDLEGGNLKQRWCELFPPKVMLETGCKKGVSCSRKLHAKMAWAVSPKGNVGNWTQRWRELFSQRQWKLDVTRCELFPLGARRNKAWVVSSKLLELDAVRRVPLGIRRNKVWVVPPELRREGIFLISKENSWHFATYEVFQKERKFQGPLRGQFEWDSNSL